jgi:hypothetical protein
MAVHHDQMSKVKQSMLKLDHHLDSNWSHKDLQNTYLNPPINFKKGY